jgi:hypothetical protein
VVNLLFVLELITIFIIWILFRGLIMKIYRILLGIMLGSSLVCGQDFNDDTQSVATEKVPTRGRARQRFVQGTWLGGGALLGAGMVVCFQMAKRKLVKTALKSVISRHVKSNGPDPKLMAFQKKMSHHATEIQYPELEKLQNSIDTMSKTWSEAERHLACLLIYHDNELPFQTASKYFDNNHAHINGLWNIVLPESRLDAATNFVLACNNGQGRQFLTRFLKDCEDLEGIDIPASNDPLLALNAYFIRNANDKTINGITPDNKYLLQFIIGDVSGHPGIYPAAPLNVKVNHPKRWAAWSRYTQEQKEKKLAALGLLFYSAVIGKKEDKWQKFNDQITKIAGELDKSGIDSK